VPAREIFFCEAQQRKRNNKMVCSPAGHFVVVWYFGCLGGHCVLRRAQSIQAGRICLLGLICLTSVIDSTPVGGVFLYAPKGGADDGRVRLALHLIEAGGGGKSRSASSSFLPKDSLKRRFLAGSGSWTSGSDVPGMGMVFRFLCGNVVNSLA